MSAGAERSASVGRDNRGIISTGDRSTIVQYQMGPLPERDGPPVGLVIDELDERDALALEVHRAFEVEGVPAAAGEAAGAVLPVYLERPGFDDRLRGAVAAAEHGSRLVMVVGGSSTGKTRACWEAVRAELPDWRLWHPLTPERPMAVVEAVRRDRVAARSVIWLNEAQFYLQAPQVGELVAAELQALLADGARGPVLVLGSMWPEFWRVLTSTPEHGAAADPHRAARSLLAQGTEVTSPPSFTPGQLTELAEAISADPRLAVAAERAPGGQLTQELAGAPELLRRYLQGSPAVRAVLWAAMDARRLGHGPYLPEPLLRDAAPGYLDDHTWDQVGGAGWFTTALQELTALHRRLPGPLTGRRPRPGEPPAAVPLYRLADYLEQHGRAERAQLCPPAAFWDAAAHHARTPADQSVLGNAARDRGRYRHAALLYRQAADAGDLDALRNLAYRRQEAGDRQGAERLYRQGADAGDPYALWALADLWEEAGDREGAGRLYRQAADAGHPRAWSYLAELREEAGDREGAERAAQQGADAGDPDALWNLAYRRRAAGDWQGAERLYRQAADAGAPRVLMELADMWEEAEDRERAERLYRQAADAGESDALWALADLWEEVGDRERAEHFYRQAADAGDPDALWALARLWEEEPGGWERAERLYRQGADAGNPDALWNLARLWEEAGDRERAERLYRQGADAGNPGGLWALAGWREEAGDREGAEYLALRAADAGHMDALRILAGWREEAGDREGAEYLALRAADAGHMDALRALAGWRQGAGDREDAERLYRQLADAGYSVLGNLAQLREEAGDREGGNRLRRFGLDADGEIEEPWVV
ncbi:hypothetical protein [Actinomadura sp. 21ATH]|uniref:hypothetical protein n=1 Tax=Actinomadura sp. 21ATH TaxID=1735444 RepID=UPI0035C101A4